MPNGDTLTPDTTTPSYTALEVWGFGESLAVNCNVNEFLKAMDLEARDRGIDPTKPSDALDLSRDLILDEAARRVGVDWGIIDGILRLQPQGWAVDWEALS